MRDSEFDFLRALVYKHSRIHLIIHENSSSYRYPCFVF